MEYITSAIETTLSSFDFAFCIVVNVLTYLIIKWLSESKFKFKISTWRKRIILIISIIVVSIVYSIFGVDNRLILNSAILAPVTWSWIFRPICEKFGLNYVKDDINQLHNKAIKKCSKANKES